MKQKMASPADFSEKVRAVQYDTRCDSVIVVMCDCECDCVIRKKPAVFCRARRGSISHTFSWARWERRTRSDIFTEGRRVPTVCTKRDMSADLEQQPAGPPHGGSPYPWHLPMRERKKQQPMGHDPQHFYN